MLAFEMEQAIRQLEETTEALLTTEAKDLGALCAVLENRANAITKVALLAEQAREGGSAVERLATVLVRGEEATRRMLNTRRETSDEWCRLNNVLRGMGIAEVREGRLDYSA